MVTCFFTMVKRAMDTLTYSCYSLTLFSLVPATGPRASCGRLGTFSAARVVTEVEKVFSKNSPPPKKKNVKKRQPCGGECARCTMLDGLFIRWWRVVWCFNFQSGSPSLSFPRERGVKGGCAGYDTHPFSRGVVVSGIHVVILVKNHRNECVGPQSVGCRCTLPFPSYIDPDLTYSLLTFLVYIPSED